MFRGRRGRFAIAALTAVVLLGGGWVAGSPAADSAASHWNRQSVPGQHAQLFAVSCSSARVCTAVGDRTPGGGSHLTPLVERWSGHRWRIQRTPRRVHGYLYSVSCPSPRDCMAVGASNLAERWSGGRWSVQRIRHANEYLWGVSCSAPTACTAVGSYTKPGSHRSLPLAARWNGRRWTMQPLPNPSYSRESWLQAVSCPSATACTAVGFAGYGIGNAKRPLVEQWDGRHWALQRPPSPAGTNETDLSGISCPSTRGCTAVGDYVKNRNELTLAEQWNGRTWALQKAHNPAAGTGVLSGDWFYRVSCSSGTACTAVGGLGGFESTVTLAERWDGHSWTVQRTAHPRANHASDLSGVSCPTTSVCTAVGSYDNWHGPGVPLAERYS